MGWVHVAGGMELKGAVTFETADLETLEGSYDTTTCIDVSLFGSSSLVTILKRTPPSWSTGTHVWTQINRSVSSKKTQQVAEFASTLQCSIEQVFLENQHSGCAAATLS